MVELGKKIRLDRIMNRETHKTVIVPLDHGVTVGPIKGLEDMAGIIEKVAEGGADAVLLHKGFIGAGYRGKGRDIGLIMHLTASTALGTDSNNKVEVATVEEAIEYAADAVSIHINVGSETEPEQLQYLGRVSHTCKRWGMPLVAMMYPRGTKVKDENSVEYVKHAVRVGADLGADIIKTNYTGSEETFREVVKGVYPTPVVMAGGPKTKSNEEFFQNVYASILAGGAGVAGGRNVFQDEKPTRMVKILSGIVHEGLNVKESMTKYNR